MNKIQKLDNHLNALLSLSEVHWDQNKRDKVRAGFEVKKSETVPRVLLFGSYNAGKSSLINALLQEEVAKMGDVPETATSEEFLWEGCYLRDSPGVNAPIEHESVTEEHINRSDLLLFVIRQGDQDVKDVYERMFTFLKNKKQIFIVYNHELVGEELVQASAQLNKILMQSAQEYGVEDEQLNALPVIPINVKTALKAGLKGSEALAIHSGIETFKDKFRTWVSQFDTQEDYWKGIRNYLINILVDPLFKLFDEKNDMGSNKQVKSLQAQRQLVIKEFDYVSSRTVSLIRGKINEKKSKIESFLYSASMSQASLESDVQTLAAEIMDSTTEYIRQECDKSAKALSGSVDVSKALGVDAKVDSSFMEQIEPVVLKGLKSINADLLKQGFLTLRKMKVPYFKGRWEKTLGKWAGKAAPIITIATSLYEVYSASSAQDKHNEEVRQQKLMVYQAVDDISSSILVAVKEPAISSISMVRDGVVQSIQSDLDAITETLSITAQKRTRLEQIQSDLVSE